ncbi:MAG: 50S ribosomal protein L4 [Elusimicrobia bacterium RIFOXYB2_FULL_49_7]|nr:MAG: 50S ribosomal protein L4 [Elusimicrobia bacterium RIFOXYB2_FULL_49_7]
METTVYNVQGKESGKVELPALFETKVSAALLHEVVTGYLANQRQGTHKTKSRGEVSGGGHKPWREKGTGNARAGSTRSPLWRKGGIIFGPRPRDYYQRLPQQKRELSLHMALTERMKEGSFIVVDSVAVKEPKTKNMAEILKNLKVQNNSLLLVLDKADAALKRASKNIPELVIAEVKNLNAYQVLWAKKIVCTVAAIEKLKAAE